MANGTLLLTESAAGDLGTGNVSVANTVGAILTCKTASISDLAILSFGHNSVINLNAASGSETIFALFDTSTNTTHAAGTFSAAQLDIDFGGISTFTASGAQTLTIISSVVPEPSAFAMMLGGVGMLLATSSGCAAIGRSKLYTQS